MEKSDHGIWKQRDHMALGKSSLRRAVDRHPVEADGAEAGNLRSFSMETEG